MLTNQFMLDSCIKEFNVFAHPSVISTCEGTLNQVARVSTTRGGMDLTRLILSPVQNFINFKSLKAFSWIKFGMYCFTIIRFAQCYMRHQDAKKVVILQQKTAEFVKEFLKPYLTGKITKENESKTRAPMIEQLIIRFTKHYTLSKADHKIIEVVAMRTFINEAILGYYKLSDKETDFMDRASDILPGDERFSEVIKTITTGITKEFSKQFNSQFVLHEIAPIFEGINRERDQLRYHLSTSHNPQSMNSYRA